MAVMGMKLSGKGILREALPLVGQAVGSTMGGPVGGVVGKDVGTEASNMFTKDNKPTMTGNLVDMFKGAKGPNDLPKGNLGNFMSGSVEHDGQGSFSIKGLDLSSIQNLFSMGGV